MAGEVDMQLELATVCLEKSKLRTRLDELNTEAKALARQVELPFAVQVDGYAVVVKKGQYYGGPPQYEIAPLLCSQCGAPR